MRPKPLVASLLQRNISPVATGEGKSAVQFAVSPWRTISGGRRSHD